MCIYIYKGIYIKEYIYRNIYIYIHIYIYIYILYIYIYTYMYGRGSLTRVPPVSKFVGIGFGTPSKLLGFRWIF